MPSFGKASLERYATLDPRLQEILDEVIKYKDFTIVCGHRGQVDQDKAVADGLSKTKWPNSKHNSLPSRAVDVAPYPIDWHDTVAFSRLIGALELAAAQKGIKVRWGGDFDSDGKTYKDDDFVDLPHLELV